MYVSTKTYGHEAGFTVAYRQYLADSHCKLIHGYSLAFYFEFESQTLDARNWCVDFGSLKSFKEFLNDYFDHTFLATRKDPWFHEYERWHKEGIIKLVEVEATGCEALSKFLFNYINDIWLPENYPNHDGQIIRCRKVRVSETPSNSAWYEE